MFYFAVYNLAVRTICRRKFRPSCLFSISLSGYRDNWIISQQIAFFWVNQVDDRKERFSQAWRLTWRPMTWRMCRDFETRIAQLLQATSNYIIVIVREGQSRQASLGDRPPEATIELPRLRKKAMTFVDLWIGQLKLFFANAARRWRRRRTALDLLL